MTMNMNLTMTITITKHSFALVAMALQRRILKMDLLPSTSVFSNANHCILDDCEDLQRRVVYKKIRHVSIQNSAVQKQKSTLLIPPTEQSNPGMTVCCVLYPNGLEVFGTQNRCCEG